MKNPSSFSVYKKKSKGKETWYALFPDPDNPSKRSAKSVETLRIKLGLPASTPMRRIKDVTLIVQKALDADIVRPDGKRDPIFIDYVNEYWDFENSKSIKLKNSKRPNALGVDYATNIKGTFMKNAAPLLPKTLRLSQVKPTHIQHVIDTLFTAQPRLADATIYRVRQSMAIPLKNAVRQDLIPTNPMERVETVSVTKNSRGIPTRLELERLCKEIMLKGIEAGTFDRGVYLAILLAIYTGMREGEIRGLHAENIQVNTEGDWTIFVAEAYAAYAGFKVPKGKIERSVYPPAWLCEDLLDYAKKNPCGSSLVFWSKNTSNPISASHIRKHLYRALWDLFEQDNDCVGELVQDRELIDKKGNPVMIRKGEAIRRERNIDFHSLRHYHTTKVAESKVIPEAILLKVIGHKDAKTTEGYTHITKEMEDKLREVSNNILAFPAQEQVKRKEA